MERGYFILRLDPFAKVFLLKINSWREPLNIKMAKNIKEKSDIIDGMEKENIIIWMERLPKGNGMIISLLAKIDNFYIL